jgi:hypothetical protein
LILATVGKIPNVGSLDVSSQVCCHVECFFTIGTPAIVCIVLIKSLPKYRNNTANFTSTEVAEIEVYEDSRAKEEQKGEGEEGKKTQRKGKRRAGK